MKQLLFVISLFVGICSFAQQESNMSDMIKYCIEDYYYKDSLFYVEHRTNDPTKTEKIVCSEGLPRGFDSSLMPNYTFHQMDKKSIKDVFRKLHRRYFGTLFISIKLEQDTFFVYVCHAGIYRKRLSRWTNVLTSNSREYVYKFDTQKAAWILTSSPKSKK